MNYLIIKENLLLCSGYNNLLKTFLIADLSPLALYVDLCEGNSV